MNPLVIYRTKSLDSFASAVAVWIVCPDFEFYAASPEEEPPWGMAKDRLVYLIDCAYSKDWVKRLSRVSACLIVLDHHEAMIDLKHCLGGPRLRGVIDTTESGIYLTWGWFHGTELPKLFAHVADAHLDKWELEGTKEIVAALAKKPRKFKEWEKYLYKPGCLLEKKSLTETLPLVQMYLPLQDIDASIDQQQPTIAGFIYTKHSSTYQSQKEIQ